MNRLRGATALLILLIGLKAQATGDDVWRERFILWPVFSHYGLTYYGQRFMVTLRMYEDGAVHRFGYENPDWDRDLCPCVSRDQREAARATLAFIRALQAFVLNDAELRPRFMSYWAGYYHANGTEADARYSKEMKQVWKRAGKWMSEHGLDQTKGACLHPFEGVGWGSTTWNP